MASWLVHSTLDQAGQVLASKFNAGGTNPAMD